MSSLSPLTNASSQSNLIGWTTSSAVGPKPFLCPLAGLPVQQEMTDAQINNEQWSHTSNHLPQTFPHGGDLLDPKWSIFVSPWHQGSYTHFSGWQQFVDMGLGSRTFTRLLGNKCFGYKGLQKQHQFVMSLQIVYSVPWRQLWPMGYGVEGS